MICGRAGSRILRLSALGGCGGLRYERNNIWARIAIYSIYIVRLLSSEKMS